MRALILAAVLTIPSPLIIPSASMAQDNQALATELGETIRSESADSGHSVGYGVATAVFEAPADRVMRAITDYANYKDFLPRFRQSRVLSQRGRNALVYMQASAMRGTVTIWANMRIYARRPQGETQILEGRMVEGNLDKFTARWEVTPLDTERCIVRFRILTEPQLPVPDSMVTSENVSIARRSVRGLRRHVQHERYQN
ncbi:MAG: SRPBCC family protein [Myxococcota bacterium]